MDTGSIDYLKIQFALYLLLQKGKKHLYVDIDEHHQKCLINLADAVVLCEGSEYLLKNWRVEVSVDGEGTFGSVPLQTFVSLKNFLKILRQLNQP